MTPPLGLSDRPLYRPRAALTLETHTGHWQRPLQRRREQLTPQDFDSPVHLTDRNAEPVALNLA